MADQKINALPTKTAPVTGDKCLMSGAAEEYLIDYDKLATAMSKNIFYGTAINSNDDMNDYTVPGIYYSPSSVITKTLKNKPPEDISTGFALLVLPTSEKNGTIVQVIIKGVTADNIYARSQNTSQWYQWRKFSGTMMS